LVYFVLSQNWWREFEKEAFFGGVSMKIGDLVVGVDLLTFSDYGIGIVLSIEYGNIKVYWPTQACWCYTSERGVRLL
tara:strand:- start:1544 stop:1774 length:231 start_codon:yes stop_codon:yes gene_type:complete